MGHGHGVCERILMKTLILVAVGAFPVKCSKMYLVPIFVGNAPGVPVSVVCPFFLMLYDFFYITTRPHNILERPQQQQGPIARNKNVSSGSVLKIAPQDITGGQ